MTVAIIGSTTLKQLNTNLEALELSVTPEIEPRIDAVHLLYGGSAP